MVTVGGVVVTVGEGVGVGPIGDVLDVVVDPVVVGPVVVGPVVTVVVGAGTVTLVALGVVGATGPTGMVVVLTDGAGRGNGSPPSCLVVDVDEAGLSSPMPPSCRVPARTSGVWAGRSRSQLAPAITPTRRTTVPARRTTPEMTRPTRTLLRGDNPVFDGLDWASRRAICLARSVELWSRRLGWANGKSLLPAVPRES